MSNSNTDFDNILVADVMERNIECVAAHHSITDVSKLLEEKQIGSAVVVDETNKFVGIITDSDLARYHFLLHSAMDNISMGMTYDMINDDSPEGMHIEPRPFDEVRRHMTRATQTVKANTTLREASRIMCQQHVHHLVILDSNARPEGILSSLDILSRIANVEIFRTNDAASSDTAN